MIVLKIYQVPIVRIGGQISADHGNPDLRSLVLAALWCGTTIVVFPICAISDCLSLPRFVQLVAFGAVTIFEAGQVVATGLAQIIFGWYIIMIILTVVGDAELDQPDGSHRCVGPETIFDPETVMEEGVQIVIDPGEIFGKTFRYKVRVFLGEKV